MIFTKRAVSVLVVIATLVSCLFGLDISVNAAKQYTLSARGLELIKYYEGYSKYAYKDYGHYSIGYGTTCEPDEYPNGISEEYASKLLVDKMGSYEAQLDKFLDKYGIKVNQNQYDALVSITYNVGGIWSRDSNLRTILINGVNKYTDQQITSAFGEFCKAGGNVLSGLVKRRSAEAALFLEAPRVVCTLFDDVPDASWAFAAVKFVFQRGYFSGTGTRTFSPDASMTRAMAVTVLSKVAGANLSNFNRQIFSDVPVGKWYTSAVCWANSDGCAGGIGNGMFAPEAPVTRQQLIVMMYGYATSNGKTKPSLSVAAMNYSDSNKIDHYALEAMNWAVDNGIISGSDGKLSPKSNATRAQAAVMFKQFALLIGK